MTNNAHVESDAAVYTFRTMPTSPQAERIASGAAIDDLTAGVLAGDRAALGRAITLVESHRSEHRERAQELLTRLLPDTGKAHRIGVTGVPGVGKSTFLDALGTRLTERDHRVAVLAVDPSSTVTGGSILGDKTRMERLASDPKAFIRPSPSGGSLGGVARKTRETMLLCEAAGYDVVFVETVGVGQSEIVVAGMVDCVLLLLLPNAGDELQGIKRGILERVDVLAVNKADGERVDAARQARQQYLSALKLLRPSSPGWRPPVVAVSARDGDGLGDLWSQIETHRSQMAESGELDGRRRRQRLEWLRSLVEEEVLAAFRQSPGVARCLPEIEQRVEAGEVTPAVAAARLLAAWGDGDA